jgi:6-phosphogluconate dehydrogenase
MVPAGGPTESTVTELGEHLSAGDTVIDGGNSFFKDDVRRGKALATKSIHYVDAGTSGGVYGLERGYCMMIGGEAEVVRRLDPSNARPGATSPPAPPRRATCTVVRSAPATSSR